MYCSIHCVCTFYLYKLDLNHLLEHYYDYNNFTLIFSNISSNGYSLIKYAFNLY